MNPGSCVCGLYLAHPNATDTGVGPNAEAQMEDYAKRKDLDLKECERWLAPNRGY